MKIVFIITSISMGGAETQLFRIVENLKKNTSYNITVISLIDPTYQPYVDWFNLNGINYINLSLKKDISLFSKLFKLINIINNIKPNVIHSHMIHANYFSRLIKPFISCPKIINTIHGEEELFGLRSKFYLYTNSSVYFTSVISSELRSLAIEKGLFKPHQIRLVNNGLDLSKYNYSLPKRHEIRAKFDISDIDFVWITVGRLQKVKNHELMLNSIEWLESKNISNIKLFIVGDGEERSNLQNYVNNSNFLKNKVVFLGIRTDIPELLSSADGFLLSSLHEGLPLVLQEAAAIGLPIVSTNVGGCSEVIHDCFNGFLVDNLNRDEFADRMLKIMLLTNEMKDEFSLYSKDNILKSYDMEIIGKEWRAYYE